MQERSGTPSDANLPQAASEPADPRPESEQVEEIGDIEQHLAKIKEVDSIAQRERERIQRSQIAKYGELVHREDEPLYGLEPIEGGAHEMPKEEPAPAGVRELNLTWAIVFGTWIILALFAGVLFYSVYIRGLDPNNQDPNILRRSNWGTENTTISPPPFR